ncbi:flavin reductase family protein [Ignavibacterium sp.]|uniref:flavin reductase family protein n=1 Tax=Ignavibacterium sp. TaxID=2651167 RepID=UPI0026229E75|nr:flavin reductase family protein [Ignavibacterium sp.]
MKITNENILQFEKLFRTNFVNSLSGFKSANLIGTISKKGKTNLAIFSSVIHVGANPPLIGMLVRPASVPRHTYENIKDAGYFTINHINKEIYKQAHQTSARYDKDVSEFDECGLTPEFANTIKAPYVKESNIKIGCRFVEEHLIKTNDTIFIVGEILEVIIPDDVLTNDGYVDIEKAGTIAISALDSYHETKRIARLTYAKPRTKVKEL